MTDTTNKRNISDTARWVARCRALESDRPDAWFPELLSYKGEAPAGENPVCALERMALDLANVGARRDLLKELGV